MENPGEFERNEVGEQPSETSEVGERLNDATLRPEEVVEFQGNIEEAEAVEQAFTEAVTVRGEAESAALPALIPSMEDAQSGITISPVEGGASRGGSADEISATPITLPMEDPDGVPDAIADALVVDSDGDGSELEIVDPEGNTGDEFVGLDDGLEQNVDMRRPPNEDGGLDDLWGAEQGEAVGYLGEVDALGVEVPGQDDHGLGDPMTGALGGKGGQGVLDDGVMDFGEMGVGPDQEGEMADLMATAMGGRGGLMDDDDAGGTTGGTSDDTSGGSSGSSSGGTSDDSADWFPGPFQGGTSGGGTPIMPIQVPTSDHSTSSTEKKADISSAQGDNAGVMPGVISGSFMPREQSSSTGSRIGQANTGSRIVHVNAGTQSYDPEGTVESAGGEPDRTLGGLVEDPVPHVSPLDEMDLQQSMSQPAGEDDTRNMESTPPPELGEQALSGNLDPYINWGDEHSEGGTGAVGGEVDIRPIDPPEMVGSGVGGGIMDSDKENADSADLGNDDLEDTDGLSGGAGDDPF